uniref:hypothetical protein n=1 Tax=Amanita sinensis TaxID=67728 RepID=UPI001D1103FC|nr:hypothetical protein LK379_mgp08 [Amanita sinensis]QZN08151.1 hypothetical protein [Amanita sinensis]
MNKNFLTNSLKAISGLASIISIQSYFKTMTDATLQENLKNSENKIKILEEKLNNCQLDELKNEVLKNKIELLKINLNECQKNASKEIELLKGVEVNNSTLQNDVKYHVNNYIKENEKAQNFIEEFLFNLIDKNKFIGDSNLIENVKQSIDNMNKFIAQLNVEQLGAFAHLSSSIFMLLCLFSIITIVYSDFLINSFKLEEKYPKLSRILKIRKMFQQYYLFINFILIFLTLVTLIYINFKILIITTF